VTDRIVVRDLASHEDYAACVQLQRDTWGADFKDVVPASIQLVSQKLGGVAAGAFDELGRMVGFVYGMTGVERGKVVHWSDMLAVRPEVRNAGIGRRLKEHQRKAVARAGGEVIYWTYDPLVARNAHLNFNVFGVRVVEYVRDMYGGNTGSALHRVGTDRLIVAWPVKTAAASKRKTEIARARKPRKGELLVDIPRDIESIIQLDPATAVKWRASVRTGLEAALTAGYRLDGVRIDDSGARYVLTPARTPGTRRAAKRSRR
jgi:chorismate synthase